MRLRKQRPSPGRIELALCIMRAADCDCHYPRFVVITVGAALRLVVSTSVVCTRSLARAAAPEKASHSRCSLFS